MQGEVAKSVEGAPKRSAMWIVRNLGLVGLYKGATACLLRDVPFSAIYFPTYSHLKKDLFGESPTKKLGILQLLTAGAIAGMPPSPPDADDDGDSASAPPSSAAAAAAAGDDADVNDDDPDV